MQINKPTPQQNFKGLYLASSNIEQRVMWNKAIVTGGVDAGWIIKANNPVERNEKARRVLSFLALTFLTPMITLPISNRFAMKHIVKLTKGLASDNHKAIHLSNKYLTSAEKTKEGLSKLSKEYTYSPFEMIYKKLKGEKLNKPQLNFDELLEKCGGDYEKLRHKLINAKGAVFTSDIIFTALTTGSIGFVNNVITKKKTGKSGFSAEMEMADKDVVAKRAQGYEKNWKKRFGIFLGATLAVATALPLAIKKGLTAKTVSDFTKKVAPKFDYNDGIYMSRLSLLLGGVALTQTGTLLSSRNKTETKDQIIRYSMTDALFFGGDILLGSVFANLSDKTIGTKLIKPSDKNTTFNKIFPNYKSLKDISEEVNAGNISKKNKPIALALWWTNLALVTTGIGILVPTLINKMIRKDVNKDVQAHNLKLQLATPTSKTFEGMKLAN